MTVHQGLTKTDWWMVAWLTLFHWAKVEKLKCSDVKSQFQLLECFFINVTGYIPCSLFLSNWPDMTEKPDLLDWVLKYLFNPHYYALDLCFLILNEYKINLLGVCPQSQRRTQLYTASVLFFFLFLLQMFSVFKTFLKLGCLTVVQIKNTYG